MSRWEYDLEKKRGQSLVPLKKMNRRELFLQMRRNDTITGWGDRGSRPRRARQLGRIHPGSSGPLGQDGRPDRKGTVKGSEIEWQIVPATCMGDVNATFEGKVDGGPMGKSELMETTNDWAASRNK